jgi:hypothetical protein
LERLGEVRARLQAGKDPKQPSGHPSGRMVEAVHQALEKALRQAESMEEVALLEEQLRVVLQASRCLEAGVGGLEGQHAAQELLRVATALGVAQVGGSDAPPAGPGWQADSWGSAVAQAGPSGPTPGGTGAPAGGPGGLPSGLGWHGESASASPAGGPSGLPSGLGWHGESASGVASQPDPMGHLRVPAVLTAVQSEGQQVSARCWSAASALEGPLHDPAAKALAELGRRLGGCEQEDEALEQLKRLRALEQALTRCQRATQGSAEGQEAQAMLQALLNHQA